MEVNVENKEVINKETVVENNNKDVKKDDGSNKKKILLFIGIVLFIIGIVIIFIVAILGTNNEDKDKGKEDNKVVNNKVENTTYFVYVDIKPAIKVSIEEKYTDCSTGKCLVEIMATGYEVIEEDKNGVFKDYKLETKEFNVAMNEILKKAEKKGVDVSNVDFYSDSSELGGYLDLDVGLYGFYYSEEIDSPDEFYGRIDYEDEEYVPDTTPVIKDIRIENPEILVKNPNKNYNYNLTNKGDIVATVKGTFDEIAYLDKYSFIFSVDVSDAEVGTYEFDINYSFTYSLDVEVELSPDTVEIIVSDRREVTTTRATTTTSKKEESSKSTTKTSTTKKTTTTSRNDVEINLNDNVQYFDVTSCGGYLSIKKECVNATIGELKTKYPDYNKDLDSEDYLKDSMKLDTYQITYYFPGCEKTITSDTKNKLSKKQGFYMEFEDVFMRPYWIQFKDDKYVKFEWQIADFTNEDLYYSANCGGGDSSDINYKTLDEATCTKYNLPCARW